MSQWHRENPEMIGTQADPWMGIESYRKTIEPEVEGEECETCGLRDAATNWRGTPVCNICKEVLADV